MANQEREPGNSEQRLKLTRRQALAGTGAVLGGIAAGYGPRWLRDLLATEPPIEAAAKGIEPVVTPTIKPTAPAVEASPAASPSHTTEPSPTNTSSPTATATEKPSPTASSTATATVKPTNTATAAPTYTPEPTSTPTPDAQAEQIKQAELNKMAKQIGIPDKYRLATEKEIAYFVPVKKGEKPYIERITLTTGANGEVLVPVYPKGSIIGDYALIDLRKIYPKDYWLASEEYRQEWIAGLEKAVFALLQGDSKEARRNLLWVQKEIKELDFSSIYKQLDKNKDGVTDHVEELSKAVNALLENPLLK